MASAMIPLAFATLFVTVSVLFVALAFATDHWQETLVRRTELKVQATTNPTLRAQLATPLYFTRYRGMFRTCYPGNETLFLDAVDNKVDNCIPQSGYELPSRREETINWGPDYEMRIHLLRSHFAFFVLALLLLVTAAILGVVGCWQARAKVLRTTGLIAFFGAFFALGGMAIFHGYEFLENAKIEVPEAELPAYWENALEHRTLQKYASVQYGYSYMLGWIGVALAAIAAILFLVAAIFSSDAENEDTSPLAMKERNRAYDHMGQQSVVGSGMGAQNPAMAMQPQTMMQPQVMAPQVVYPAVDYSQMTPGYAASNMAYDFGTGAYTRY